MSRFRIRLIAAKAYHKSMKALGYPVSIRQAVEKTDHMMGDWGVAF